MHIYIPNYNALLSIRFTKFIRHFFFFFFFVELGPGLDKWKGFAHTDE